MGPGQVCLSLASGTLEAVVLSCLSQSLINCPNRHISQPPNPRTQGVLHFQTVEKSQAEPMARGGTDTVPTVWHLLIREEFAWRTGLGQLVCCVLSCNRDTAGWHGLGPSHWAAVFGSSKSSALLEQRGIQDADPTEDEKATGSQTPCPAPPTQGVWLKLSSDLETQWLGSRGQMSSLHSQCYLGDRVGRETETGGDKS